MHPTLAVKSNDSLNIFTLENESFDIDVSFILLKNFRSFAYPSLKDRTPIILTTIIDHLSREKDSIIKIRGEVRCKQFLE